MQMLLAAYVLKKGLSNINSRSSFTAAQRILFQKNWKTYLTMKYSLPLLVIQSKILSSEET